MSNGSEHLPEHTGDGYKALTVEARRFVIMDRDSREGVVMLVKRLADAVEALVAERDALRAQLDGMTTEWARGDNEILPVEMNSESKARFYAKERGERVYRRFVGPWVEVTD